jgi:hypothetical protein
MTAYRTSNGKFTNRQGLLVDIATIVYPLKKDGGDDLRFRPTFEFLPEEDPRVTFQADLDLRFTPNGVTRNGQLDRRYKSNRLALSLNGAGEVEVEA